MKTDIKIALVLIFNAALAILSLTCCDKSNNTRMLWSVSSHNRDNVEISFDPSRRPQIEIVASAEGGECRISCPNYEHISFRETDIRSNVLTDVEGQFHAKIIAPGVISIKLDKMPQGEDNYCSYFIIDGVDGDDISVTVVKVTRQA